MGPLVWHESETEAKKLKGGRFSSPSASDQAVQAVGELQLCAPQKPASDIKTDHEMVGGLFLSLSRHIAIMANVSRGITTTYT